MELIETNQENFVKNHFENQGIFLQDVVISRTLYQK